MRQVGVECCHQNWVGGGGVLSPLSKTNRKPCYAIITCAVAEHNWCESIGADTRLLEATRYVDDEAAMFSTELVVLSLLPALKC